ncbi:MAG: hypothetical protein WHV26_09570 [Spirochaetota bacterium]
MSKHVLKRLIVTISIVFTILCLALTYDTLYTITFDHTGLDLFNAKRVTLKGGGTGYTVAQINYKETVNPLITDLLLTFDKDFPYLLKDDAGHYAVRYAQYLFSKDDTEGEGSAQFFHKDHRVEIQTAKQTWLTNCDDLGSFTIEIKFKLTRYSSNAVLLSRIGYSAGKSGFEIVCVNNRLAIRFYKMFYKKDNVPVDVYLQRSPVLNLNEWYHCAVSFDRISGRLETLLNGTVVETVFCTESGEPFIDVLVPRFRCSDIPVALVGKDVYGVIDVIKISQRYIVDLEKETQIAKTNYKAITYYNRETINREGIITSPVYQFPDYGTMVTLFKWNEMLPPSTYIWMEFRISDEFFKQDDPSLRWYRINNNQKNIYLHKAGDEFLRGKYYQWRAHLIASPDGLSAPIIYNIGLEYTLDTAPQPPTFVTVDAVSEKAIRLKWKKNVEHDILGYKIYYGVKSKNYDGVISLINGKRISNELSDNSGYISVTINNDIIEENRLADTKGFLTYPLLQNNVLYFFAVAAYDSYKPDTMFNHESKHSKEVSARPDPGSDIK